MGLEPSKWEWRFLKTILEAKGIKVSGEIERVIKISRRRDWRPSSPPSPLIEYTPAGVFSFSVLCGQIRMRKYAGGRIPNNGQLAASKDASNCPVLLCGFSATLEAGEGCHRGERQKFRGKGKREEDWKGEIQAWLRGVFSDFCEFWNAGSKGKQGCSCLTEIVWSILRFQFETTMEICVILYCPMIDLYYFSGHNCLIFTRYTRTDLYYCICYLAMITLIWLWLFFVSFVYIINLYYLPHQAWFPLLG